MFHGVSVSGQRPKLRRGPVNVEPNTVASLSPITLLELLPGAPRVTFFAPRKSQALLPSFMTTVPAREACYLPGTPSTRVRLEWPGSPNPIVSTDTVVFHGGVLSFMPYLSHSS